MPTFEIAGNLGNIKIKIVCWEKRCFEGGLKEQVPYAEIVEIPSGPVIISQNPSDDKFIRCAAAVGADVIVSGDQHLLSLKEHGGIKILTPARFLAKPSE